MGLMLSDDFHGLEVLLFLLLECLRKPLNFKLVALVLRAHRGMFSLDLGQLLLEFQLHRLAKLGVLSLCKDKLLLKLGFLQLEFRDLRSVL